MITELIPVDPVSPQEDILERAAGIIRRGGLVAFPTETVYGLGADAFDKAACESIFAAKNRPADNPLILHIANMAALDMMTAEIPQTARLFAEKFWPGPLTMVFKKSPTLPSRAAAGLETVAVRMPSGIIIRRLIELSGKIIAAPSANSSGKPSPTRASRVLEDLDGVIPMILDGGPTEYGLESTVVDVTGDTPAILRPGAITLEMLETAAGIRIIDMSKGETPERPASPGMKYRHYAPRADIVVISGDVSDIVETTKTLVLKSCAENVESCKIGIMATDETLDLYDDLYAKTGAAVISVGSRARLETVAARLFEVLREFDERGVHTIYAEGFPADGVGAAVMNRLVKAAGGRLFRRDAG